MLFFEINFYFEKISNKNNFKILIFGIQNKSFFLFSGGNIDKARHIL